jgi:DNA-binding CsgD family transcriptional regulator
MLLGRDGERAELTRSLSEGLTALVVVGEAGVGKTSLIREAVAADPRRAFEGGALATLSWSAYLPLRRALGAPATGTWDGDPEFVAARVEERLGDGILVLDDLHWADAATMAVVPLLAGRVPILAAVRRGDPGADAAITVLSEAGFATLELAPLDEATGAELARSLRSDLGAREAAVVVRRAGGNPLLIEELVASDGNEADFGLAVRSRIGGLAATARHGLELLAVAGRPLPAPAVPGSDDLLAAGVVREVEGGIDIRHALVAEAISGDLDDEWKVAVHRELAGLLEHPGDRARHLLAAGDAAAGYEAAMVAVEESATPGERAAHLVTAALCASTDATGSADAEPSLLLRAARAAVDAADYARTGAILSRLPDDDRLQAEAAIIRARVHSEAGDYANWEAEVSRGLERAEGLGLDVEVALLAELAKVVLFREQDLAKAGRLAAEALELAEARGAYRGRAHYIVGTIQYYTADPAWRVNLPLAIDFARSEGDLAIEFVAANNLVVAHEGGGDPAEGAAIADRMMARADELRLLRWRRHFWSARLNLATHAGEYALVASAAPELLASPIMRRTREEVSSAWALSLVELGRIDEGLAVGEEALADSTLHRSNLHHLRIVAHELGGRPEDALAQFPDLLAHAENAHRIAFAAPVLEWAAYHADALPVDLPDLTEAVAVAMLHGVPHELAGIAALREGRAADAAEAFAVAAELWEPYNRQGEVRSRWASGHALAEAGDFAGAIERLEAAEEVAARHGMEPMLARIRRSLRALGVFRSAPRRRSPGTALTERERQVLALVARDLPDAVIAARLGISSRTVESQIASARRKLGAANRRQAAAMAAGAA